MNEKQREQLDWIWKVRSPKRINEIFDFICAINFFQGQFNGKIPVDDSRRAFEKIKQLLQKSQTNKTKR